MTNIDFLPGSRSNLFRRVSTKVQRIFRRIRPVAAGPRLVSAQTLPDEAFLSCFDIEAVSARLAQGDIAAAKTALLDYYGRRLTPAWPGCPAFIPDFRLDTVALSPDALMDRAEQALADPFVTVAPSPKMSVDGSVDWQFNPTAGPEWLWKLHRHPWWTLFALAYVQTGDERYEQAFVTQMLDWVAGNPMPPGKDETSPAWRLMETGLRLRLSWIPAFGVFYQSRLFSDEAKLIMLRSIYDHARFLATFKTNRNHLLRESNGLACAAVYFPEFKESGGWLQTALARLDRELTGQINQDGSHIELSTGYQWLVVDEFETLFDLLDSHNLALPHEDLARRLEAMIGVLAQLIRPDGTFPQLNDGFILWPHTRLARAGARFNRPDFIYAGTDGRQGAPPEQGSVSLDDAGLAVMRSDWTQAARYLVFDAGPYGGPHGHEDKLSFELAAFGQPFLVDSGSYTYNKKDPFRAYFVGSQGHNTVLVDGRSQVRRWHKAHLKPKIGVGNDATWLSRPEYDYVRATYSDGYGVFRLQPPRTPAMIEDVTHTRHVLFVKPDYWVIVDELEASELHTYRWLFHTMPDMNVRLDAEKRVVLRAGPQAACLHLIPANPHEVQVNALAGMENPIQGWYSPDHRHKIPATVITYESEPRSSMSLATVLYPCPPGPSRVGVRVEPLAVTGGQGIGLVVTTDRGRDYLMVSRHDGLKHFGSYQAGGLVAGVRTDHDGHSLLQFEGRSFNSEGPER